MNGNKNDKRPLLTSEGQIKAAEILNKHLQKANRELIDTLGVKIKGVERGHYGLGTHLTSELVRVQ
jgi:hypothetical protein